MTDTNLSLESDVAALKASILNRPEGQKRGSDSSTAKEKSSGDKMPSASIHKDAEHAGSGASIGTSEHAMEDEFKRKEKLLREKMRSEMGKIQSKHQQLEEVRRSIHLHKMIIASPLESDISIL